VFIERIQWQGQINKIHTKKKPDSGQSGRGEVLAGQGDTDTKENGNQSDV